MRIESLEDRRVLAASVTEFTPTNSGFVVEFSEAIDSSKLNLYDTEGGVMGAADVTLTGATTGPINGSLVADGTSLAFIATGGPLPADTYTVTLRSATNGITRLSDGALLDGEFTGSLPSGNGAAGGNFVTNFTVGTHAGLVVSLPDFARGPGQVVQAPAAGSATALPDGLAVQLSNAAGVTSLTMTLRYDPSLLDVTDVQLGADAPTGSQVEANFTVPGTITLAFFSLDPMPAGATNIIELIASVPADATYGSSHILQITALDVNAGAIAAQADDALHVVAFAGDVNANRRYDAEDARLIARVGVGLDSGFVDANPTGATVTTPLYPTIDPLILGDVTGAGGISPLDASDILRAVVGLPVPNLPSLPSAQAPFALSLSNQSFVGNQTSGTTVGTFTTSDPDVGDTFTYSLVAGTGDTHNSSFAISGSTLVTAAPLTATQGSYSIRVRTTDSTGGTFERNFLITITEANAAPTAISLSSTTLAENLPLGTLIASLSTTDPNTGDTFSYALVAGAGDTDNAAFTISGNQLLLNAAVDFETQSSYEVRLRTTDNGGLSFEQAFTLTVTNVNEAATDIALSSSTVIDGDPVGTLVGTLSANDPDAGDTLTYTLVTGDGDMDNSAFTISNDQLLTTFAADILAQSSYSIRVRVTDFGGLFYEQELTISIIEQPVAPTGISLSTNTIAEDAAIGSVVGDLTSTDANTGDTHIYTLVSGEGDTDNALFMIVDNQLVTASALDFETQETHSVRIRTTDSTGLFFEQALTIAITDVNEPPTSLTISKSTVADLQPAGTVVGTLITTDPDALDTFIYTLSMGAGDDDNGSFQIIADQLVMASAVDAAVRDMYSVRVRTEDAGGLSIEQILEILVSEVNTAPTNISIDIDTILENAPIGTVVGTLSTTDANTLDTHVYSLFAGDGDTDNAMFNIVGSQLRLAAGLDFDTQSTLSIRIRSVDPYGLSVEEILTITVLEVIE